MDDSWLEIGIFSFAPFLRSVQDFLDFVRGQAQPPLELPPVQSRQLSPGLVFVEGSSGVNVIHGPGLRWCWEIMLVPVINGLLDISDRSLTFTTDRVGADNINILLDTISVQPARGEAKV